MVPLVVTKVGRYAVEEAAKVPKNFPLPQTDSIASGVVVPMPTLPPKVANPEDLNVVVVALVTDNLVPVALVKLNSVTVPVVDQKLVIVP